MKAGIATNLFVAATLSILGVRLAGDLIFESVVYEEFGGVNGTLAGRLMGFNADAAIISEPTSLRISPAQRGGRTLHITFSATNAGILSAGAAAGVIDQLRTFLDALPQFAALRLSTAPRHSLYAHLDDPVPVTVARIQTAAWGTSEPPDVPDTCRLELFWQAMPGETVEQIDAQFSGWLEELLRSNPSVFRERPHLEHPIRWLPGSAIDASSTLVGELSAAVSATLGFQPAIAGIEGPCDMYVFHQFGIPTVLWGSRGGNTHMPDEYVEIDSLVQSAKSLLAFVCSWCGETSR
jgi:acetylornithine deacetylase